MDVLTALRTSLGMLTQRDRLLLNFAVLAQVLTSFLDLFGVILIGWVGLSAASLVKTGSLSPLPLDTIDRIGLNRFSPITQLAIVAGFAAVVLMSKSLLSALLTRRILEFLAEKQAQISFRLVDSALGAELGEVQRRSSEQLVFALSYGLNSATLKLIGQVVVAITESSLLLLMTGFLFFINPIVTLGAVVLFALVGVVLQKTLGQWATRLGLARSRVDQGTQRLIGESVYSYRELHALGRRPQMIDRIKVLRAESARIEADLQFMTLIPKYSFEFAMVVGATCLTIFLINTSTLTVAVGTLALFLATGTRVVPSLLRLQVSVLGMRNDASAAIPTFDLMAEVSQQSKHDAVREEIGHSAGREVDVPFDPDVRIANVEVRYPNTSKPALSRVSLAIKPGESVALVGPSGAGKSTLADVLLGIVSPSSGDVRISGREPSVAIAKWPGSMAYVPQTVHIAQDSLRCNIGLGLDSDSIDEVRVNEVLETVGLQHLLADLPHGLDTSLGEHGHVLSGGQRQRIGLARALYSSPRLIVLDEATSALDADTERLIGDAISQLRGLTTLVVIAHRLSTVREIDSIIYLNEGRIEAIGTFEELKLRSESFRRQASYLGL